jgi:hypothetical protein
MNNLAPMVEEKRRGKWVPLAAFASWGDAEQAMFKLQVGPEPGKFPQRVISADGKRATYVPWGKPDKSEFE